MQNGFEILGKVKNCDETPDNSYAVTLVGKNNEGMVNKKCELIVNICHHAKTLKKRLWTSTTVSHEKLTILKEVENATVANSNKKRSPELTKMLRIVNGFRDFNLNEVRPKIIKNFEIFI